MMPFVAFLLAFSVVLLVAVLISGPTVLHGLLVLERGGILADRPGEDFAVSGSRRS